MTTTQTKVRANEYPGTCTNCRGHVPAWEGSLNRTAAGWTVAHLDCHTQPATGWSNAAMAQREGLMDSTKTSATGPVYLSVKETAAAMRRALKASFPEVSFSVRMARDTAHGWIDVSWLDGPIEDAVRETVRVCQSSRFSGSDDSYHGVPQSGPVRYSCCGVVTHRNMSRETKEAIVSRINSAAGEMVACLEESPWGPRFMDGMIPVAAAEALDVRDRFGQADQPVSVDIAAHQIFARTDFAKALA